MNTGAEAVETAIKAARRWGYRVKGIADGKAEIIVADGNFHGRTTTIVGFSTEPELPRRLRPVHAGFERCRFGDIAQRASARSRPTPAAVLIEPIQGEAGIVVPPHGLSCRRCASSATAHNVLLILDEVQSGLGRTGRWFAYQHEGIRPDGADPRQGAGRRRAAGLGLRRARASVMDVFDARLAWLDLRRQCAGRRGRPGGAARHRATRGWWRSAAEDGAYMIGRLRAHPERRRSSDVRGRGLWVGVEIDPEIATAREACERLLAEGRAVEGDARHGHAFRAAADHRAGRTRLRARPHRGSRARARKQEAERGVGNAMRVDTQPTLQERMNRLKPRVPGAAQREVVRCRPGSAKRLVFVAVPDQRCTTACCTVGQTS